MEIGKLFGNESATSALLFLARYTEGTAGEIARAFQISKTQVYLQLVKLESAGIVSSREFGNQKIYSFNNRLFVKKELVELLEKYIETEMSPDKNPDFYLIRRRARATGKALGGRYEQK